MMQKCEAAKEIKTEYLIHLETERCSNLDPVYEI